MSNRQSTGAHRALFRVLSITLIGVVIAACGPDDDDGTVIAVVQDDGTVEGQIELRPDTLLNLNCAEVGIYLETCVLDDPENPFVSTVINEFDENDPDAENKFDLANAIPDGPGYAKWRFYFWATALARRASGENQYFVALALHELWDAAGDPIVQEQALKAYQSVLDNFFGSVVFFTCCANVSPDNEPVPFPVQLNEVVADNLYRTEATGLERLVPGDPLLTLSLLGQWGYTYRPANPPNFDDGVLSVNEG